MKGSFSWRQRAAQVLAGLRLKEGDPDAKRKVFDAYPFGPREYTPYKVWLEMVRRYYPWLRRPGAKGRQLPVKQGRLL